MYTKQYQLHKKKPVVEKVKKPRRKKCKNKACGKYFEPMRDFQKCCCPMCAIDFATDPKNKKTNITQRKREFKLNDKTYLLKLAQKEVNTYIRVRDAASNCISCGYIFGNRQAHASHYKPVGANQHLRFYTLNIHKSCSICNTHLSGNLREYRPKLIDKIGLEKVEAIESNHDVKKYSVEYLQRLIKVVRKKIKLYKSRRIS